MKNDFIWEQLTADGPLENGKYCLAFNVQIIAPVRPRKTAMQAAYVTVDRETFQRILDGEFTGRMIDAVPIDQRDAIESVLIRSLEDS